MIFFRRLFFFAGSKFKPDGRHGDKFTTIRITNLKASSPQGACHCLAVSLELAPKAIAVTHPKESECYAELIED